MSEYLEVGGKQALANGPYEPRHTTETVGREEEISLVTAAWMAGKHSLPLAPLLVGEPGVGKNKLVYEVARRTGKKLFIFQGHEDVTAEDLACAVRFRDDGHGMEYVASPLLTAMKLGEICFIDEIAKIRPRALALLVSVLDERRYIDSNLLGGRVIAEEGFRFIAATNTADLDGMAMPEFLRSRMRPVIRVEYPARKEIEKIIEAHHPRLHERVAPLIETFWRLWDLHQPENGHPPTPRDVIYVFSLAINWADYEAQGQRIPLDDAEHHVSLRSADSQVTITPEHLTRAFREILHQRQGTGT